MLDLLDDSLSFDNDRLLERKFLRIRIASLSKNLHLMVVLTRLLLSYQSLEFSCFSLKTRHRYSKFTKLT